MALFKPSLLRFASRSSMLGKYSRRGEKGNYPWSPFLQGDGIRDGPQTQHLLGNKTSFRRGDQSIDETRSFLPLNFIFQKSIAL